MRIPVRVGEKHDGVPIATSLLGGYTTPFKIGNFHISAATEVHLENNRMQWPDQGPSGLVHISTRRPKRVRNVELSQTTNIGADIKMTTVFCAVMYSTAFHPISVGNRERIIHFNRSCAPPCAPLLMQVSMTFVCRHYLGQSEPKQSPNRICSAFTAPRPEHTNGVEPLSLQPAKTVSLAWKHHSSTPCPS